MVASRKFCTTWYTSIQLTNVWKSRVKAVSFLTVEWYLRHVSGHSEGEWPTSLHVLHNLYDFFEDKHTRQPSLYTLVDVPHWKKITQSSKTTKDKCKLFAPLLICVLHSSTMTNCFAWAFTSKIFNSNIKTM